MSQFPVKIVVAGPVGAGKTTFIQSLSQTPVICTDELSSEDIGKEYTTVAFDYGSFNIDPYTIHLYGTPGQDRFDFMWEVLCEGALGLIIMLDGSKVAEFSKARKILDFITSRIDIPYIIGITHQDTKRSWRPVDIAAYFQIPIEHGIAVDPRDRNNSLQALYLLFGVINQQASPPEATGTVDRG